MVRLTPLTPEATLRSPLSTPQSSRELSPTSTLSVDSPIIHRKSTQAAPKDRVEAIFNVHDILVNHSGTAITLPFTNIISIGDQSAGKSSVLSMVSGVPLWSSDGTATHGPTQIHSRLNANGSFTVRIEISIAEPVEGVDRLQPFTSTTLTSKDGLSEILRLAGNEARRCGNGRTPIRTYEELMAMQPTSRESGIKHWATFTHNTVVLHVSGPSQQNVSIVDLPGLNGSALVQELAETELEKPENLILLCLAAGGGDHTPQSPAMQLVQKHDPKGTRAIGIITKADQINDPLESVYTGLILGTQKDFEWKPDHGYWPLNLRNFRKSSMEEVVDRELLTFRTHEWTEVSKQAGRKFGISPTKNKVYGLFKQMVMAHASKLQRLLNDQAQTIEDAMSAIPPEIDRPVREVNRIIDQISRHLQQEIEEKNKFNGQLLDLQEALRDNLLKGAPLFLPICKSQSHLEKQYKPLENPFTEKAVLQFGVEKIFVDEVFDILQEYTCRRDGSCGMKAARTHFTPGHAKRCEAVCADHIDELWKVVLGAVDEVSERECQEKPELKRRLLSALEGSFDKFKAIAKSINHTVCQCEQLDSRSVDTPARSSVLFAKSFDHFTAELKRLTPSQASPAPGSAATGVTPSVPAWISNEESQRRVLGTMAGLTTSLTVSSFRIFDVVGRAAQGQILDFVHQSAVTMREGLGLEDPDAETVKTMARLLEPSPELAAERKRLQKRKREIEDVGEKLRQAEAL